jgi:hypothetical protein
MTSSQFNGKSPDKKTTDERMDTSSWLPIQSARQKEEIKKLNDRQQY